MYCVHRQWGQTRSEKPGHSLKKVGVKFYTNIIYDENTVRNVRKFTKFIFYKGNVKFDDIYDAFE